MKDHLYKTYHDQLPVTIREYLNQRGISKEIIDRHFIGWNDQAITIPIFDMDNNFSFFKFRKDPSNNDFEKPKYWYQKNTSATVYGWEHLRAGHTPLIICEGELDRLALESRGQAAITSTGGAGTFKEDWANFIPEDVIIYVCFDNDNAGRNGAQAVISALQKAGHSTIYNISLPSEVGESGDVTDYFTKLNGTVDDLFSKYASLIPFTEPEALPDQKQIPRIIEAPEPEQPLIFDEWLEIIKENFPYLVAPAETTASIMAQILINDITNPFALVLVDMPSSGKTIAINFFSKIDGLVYATDKFSHAAFVSSAANIKKEKLKEVDLLPRLRYKLFLIRDLAMIFSKKDDDLNECLGLLTRALDGEGLMVESGVHGQRGYEGEFLFMLLAASTPIPPKVWKIMGSLGSRLFFMRLNSPEKDEEQLARQITDEPHKQKENRCALATKDFIYTLWRKYPRGVDWNRTEDSQQYKIIIAKCAKLLAKLRGVIQVWKERGQDNEEFEHSVPIIENPDRINQLLYNLCRGHALISGRTQLYEDDLRLIVELAIDSAAFNRAALFRAVLARGGQINTSQVMQDLNCSRPTALKEMEALKILGICGLQEESGRPGEPEKILLLQKHFLWFVSEECRKIRGLLFKDPEQPVNTGA